MKAEPQIWTSASTCFLFFTLPLVTGPLAVLGHTLAIYMELLLRSWSLAKHSIILASTKTLIHGLHVLIGTHIHECNTGSIGLLEVTYNTIFVNFSLAFSLGLVIIDTTNEPLPTHVLPPLVFDILVPDYGLPHPTVCPFGKLLGL